MPKNRLYWTDRVTTRPVQLTASSVCRVAAGPEEVWAIVRDPQTTLLLSDEVIHASRLPGFPEGVGEIRVFIRRQQGQLVGDMNEVVACEAPRRVVVRAMIDPSYSVLEETIVTPYPEGSTSSSLVTTRMGIDFPANVRAATVTASQKSLDESAARVAERLPGLFV